MATPVQLVFSGELIEGFERGEVARQLGRWLGLEEAKAIRLFSGTRIVLKRSGRVRTRRSRCPPAVPGE